MNRKIFFGIVVVMLGVAALAVAQSVQITGNPSPVILPQLPKAPTLTGTEPVWTSTNGRDVQTTTQAIANLGGGGGGAVSSVTGTAGQVNATPTTGAVVVSLPAT